MLYTSYMTRPLILKMRSSSVVRGEPPDQEVVRDGGGGRAGGSGCAACISASTARMASSISWSLDPFPMRFLSSGFIWRSLG